MALGKIVKGPIKGLAKAAQLAIELEQEIRDNPLLMSAYLPSYDRAEILLAQPPDNTRPTRFRKCKSDDGYEYECEYDYTEQVRFIWTQSRKPEVMS